MKCISCEIEINPKWTHAIDRNICPFCGNDIMEGNLKNLLTTLRENMEALQKYPDQLNDWLLSNYSFIKTDSPDIGMYMPKGMLKELRKSEEERDFLERKEKKTIKVKTENGEEEVVTQKVQSEATTNEFFKRAEAVKPNIDGFKNTSEKTERLKELKRQIERGGSPVVNQNGVAGVISPEMMENADPEEVAIYQSLMSGGDSISSSIDNNYDDEIPGENIVGALANMKNKGGNHSDINKLQQLQNRVSESRNNFNTGSKGSFSRG